MLYLLTAIGFTVVAVWSLGRFITRENSTESLELPSHEASPEVVSEYRVEHSPSPPSNELQQPELRSTPMTKEAVKFSDFLPEQFIVLDFETTGLHPATCDIIELGAVRITLEANEHAALQMFVRPKRRIPTKITAITGITQAMVDKDGEELEVAVKRLLEFIGDLPVVAYNADFDIKFLVAAAQSCGISVRLRYACALKRAKRAYPYLDNHRLQTVAEHTSAPTGSYHRAMDDSLKTAHVFLASTLELGQKVRWSNLN